MWVQTFSDINIYSDGYINLYVTRINTHPLFMPQLTVHRLSLARMHVVEDELVSRDGLLELHSRGCCLRTLIPEETQDWRAYRFLRCSSSLRTADAERDFETSAVLS